MERSDKPSNATSIALLNANIEFIKNEVSDIKRSLENRYVEKNDFEPIKRLVYGLVGLILTIFFSGLVGIIAKK